MTSRELIDFKQKSVKFIEDEKQHKILQNPLYRPILKILRSGNMTAKDIKKDYEDQTGDKINIKTLYRHLQTLTEAELITEAGVRITKETEEEKQITRTEKLYSRTAKFFYLQKKHEEGLDKKKLKRRSKVLSQLLSLSPEVEITSTECLTTLLEKLYNYEVQSTEKLFRDYPNEVAEIAGNLPLDELQDVMASLLTLIILLNFKDFEEELKECLQ
ncbi:MAG: hypothetical protein ACXABK_03095 [Candidatus Heimdallarchaeaceae archaeon]|jgi:Fe2+ or Zn2+ uptake regulation protein